MIDPALVDPKQLIASEIELVGRLEEISTFEECFERVVERKANHLITVFGYSGTGKSRLVDSFSGQVREKALYCAGKCEQTKIHEPYWVLKDALTDLSVLLLTQERWRVFLEAMIKDVRKAVGKDGSILVDIVPALETLIGETSAEATNEMDLSFGKDRVKYLFQSLFAALSKSVPLVVFCDDLQWVDEASLEVISWLATDHSTTNLLLIIAYRNNETQNDHPLTAELQKIQGKRSSETVSHIEVKNLSSKEVNTFVARSLQLRESDSEVLGEVLFEKTHGNVFYVRQLLKVLQEEDLLSFSLATMKWVWADIDRIQFNTELGDNVVSLLVNKLKRLPNDVQGCLMVASCLSSVINPTILVAVMDGLLLQKKFDVMAAIDRATKEGLLLCGRTSDSTSDVYRFAHDRVQQAAYTLMPEGKGLERLHFHIGHVLLAVHVNLSETEQSLIDFLAPNQLQQGRACITNQDELVHLAQLHLKAGKRAMSMAAFATASEYLGQGTEIMKDVYEAWDNHHDLQMELYQALADASWSNGTPSRSETFVTEILPNVKSDEERLRVCTTLAQSLGCQSKVEEALAVGTDQLMKIGVLPKYFRHTRGRILLMRLTRKLRKMSIEQLANYPECTEPVVNRFHDLLRIVVKHAYFRGDQALTLLASCLMVQLALKYGVNKEVVTSFAYVGVFVTRFLGDLEEGCRLGEMTCGLMNRYQFKDTAGLNAAWSMLNPWRQPLNQIQEPLLDAFKSGMKQGHVELALLCFNAYLFNGYLAGLELESLLQDVKSHTETAEQYENTTVLSHILPLQQAMLNLTGKENFRNPTKLSGRAMNEDQFTEEYAGNQIATFYLHVHKMVLSYYFGEYDHADKSLELVKKYGQTTVQFCEMVQPLIYEALIPLTLAFRTGQPTFKRRARRGMNLVRRSVEKEKKGINFVHRFLMLEARYLALKKSAKEHQVKDAFDMAIRQATRGGYRQDAAVANLHAGEYFLFKRQDKDWAGFYISKSIQLFEDWGAHAVAEHLGRTYEHRVDLLSKKLFRSTSFYGRKRHRSLATSFKRHAGSQLSSGHLGSKPFQRNQPAT